MFSIFEILRDNWLLLLVGQYPNGPLGGIVATLILSVLGIVLAFPLSVLLALARLSPWTPAALCPPRCWSTSCAACRC